MSETPPVPAALPAHPGYAVLPPTNTMAILALVLSFVVSVAGIVLGHLALGQIRQTGERGRELAIAGLVIGYVITGFVVLMVIAYVVFAIVGLGMMSILFGTLANT